MIPFVGIALIALLLLSVPVGATLFVLGLGIDSFFSSFPLIRGLGQVLWSSSNSFLLVAIPMFVLLGEILVRAGIAARTYAALDAWLGWMPGGLLHANIGTATLFSATSGSSVATAATVATVAMPQADKLGYDPRLFAGSIAAGGTLGILIPPSINLIVYGFLTETSIPKLFLAGLVPGVILALAFMAVAAILCVIRPGLGGSRKSAPWPERVHGLRFLVPIFTLFLIIVGSIYLGWATPTEAAALGVVAALAMAAANRTLSMPMMRDALLGTVRITAMIMFVILGAHFLNFTLSSAGLSGALRDFIGGLNMDPSSAILMVVLLYIVLGFFIETLSLMVVTIPIVAPFVADLGFDKVWFGVLLIVLVEMALITPPVGLNLYVVQGTRDRGTLNEVMVGAIPFALTMLAMVALLILVPELALWLPGLM